jgi:hypothetical protein
MTAFRTRDLFPEYMERGFSFLICMDISRETPVYVPLFLTVPEPELTNIGRPHPVTASHRLAASIPPGSHIKHEPEEQIDYDR